MFFKNLIPFHRKIFKNRKKQLANHLNGMIDAIPGCLYWKDLNGRYLGCNKLTADLAGLASPEEVVGKTDQDLWGGRHRRLLKMTKE